MDKGILIAIIGAIATLLTTILSICIKKYLNNKTKQRPITQNEKIRGKWVGTTRQKFHDRDAEFKISFIFKSENNKLKGECVVDLRETKIINLETFVIHGGLSDNRFLKIEYNNDDPNMTQFGYFLLELSPSGKNLNGCFVGYGPESKEVICGNVALEKER